MTGGKWQCAFYALDEWVQEGNGQSGTLGSSRSSISNLDCFGPRIDQLPFSLSHRFHSLQSNNYVWLWVPQTSFYYAPSRLTDVSSFVASNSPVTVIAAVRWSLKTTRHTPTSGGKYTDNAIACYVASYLPIQARPGVILTGWSLPR